MGGPRASGASWRRGLAGPGNQHGSIVRVVMSRRKPSSGCGGCNGPPARSATGIPGSVPVHRRTRLECACRPLREHLGRVGSRAPANEILPSRVRGGRGRLPHTFHRRRLRLGVRVDECRSGRFEVGQLVRNDRCAVYDGGLSRAGKATARSREGGEGREGAERWAESR